MANGGSGRGAAGGVVPWRPLVVGALALVAIAAGLSWIFADKSETATDDAYVQADQTIVSPKARGMITQILVRENQPVTAGQSLVRIDPAEYDLAIAAAQGDLLAAEAAGKAARAGLARLDAEESLAQSQVKAAQALAGPKGPTDPALRQAFETARGQALIAARSRGEIEANLAQAKAAEFRARTGLKAAQIQKANTLVAAPAAGVVANLQATVGAIVQPGVRLMTIVSTAAPYVTANFKETQTGRMRAGQVAKVRIDALPGRTLAGRVESLAPGSGAQFALLPFEPAAGNFTKIVQRVPVRIALDPGQPDLARLRPGLSAEVTVELGPAARPDR
ncbi:MAG: HlyD family secretion protein [Caulobacteraceae bacterium]|nr:HlyD family secretion protein [Caulobacteraceae bacterium]